MIKKVDKNFIYLAIAASLILHLAIVITLKSKIAAISNQEKIISNIQVNSSLGFRAINSRPQSRKSDLEGKQTAKNKNIAEPIKKETIPPKKTTKPKTIKKTPVPVKSKPIRKTPVEKSVKPKPVKKALTPDKLNKPLKKEEIKPEIKKEPLKKEEIKPEPKKIEKNKEIKPLKKEKPEKVQEKTKEIKNTEEADAKKKVSKNKNKGERDSVLSTGTSKVPTNSQVEKEAVVGSAVKARIKTNFTKKVQSSIRYPYLARRKRLQGTAIVLVKLSENGDLVSLKLKKSTGHSILDRNLISAIRKNTPYEHSAGAEIMLEIPFTYKLRRKR